MYWQNYFTDLLNTYGSSFSTFTQLDNDLVEIGDKILGINQEGELLKRPQGTGFNIVLSEHSEHLFTDIPYVLYVNYLNAIDHFSRLLMGIEENTSIERHQIHVFPRASKFFWEKEVETETGFEYTPQVERVIEGMVVFQLEQRGSSMQEQVVELTNYLLRFADGLSPDCMDDDCWKVPDIRITYNTIISEALGLGTNSDLSSNSSFEKVILNYQRNARNSALIVLRKTTQLRDSMITSDWNDMDILVFYRLCDYLVSHHVEP